MHGEIHPVHKDPVVGLSLGHAVSIGSAQTVVHQRFHTRIHLAHESLIAGVFVVVEYRLEPIERVVHDGIHVGRDGILAAQLADGALHAVQVIAQVVVHQVRLNGVAAPSPTVALDAVHEELTGGEVHRIGTHFPDTVQFFIIATERAALLFVEGSVFVVHQHLLIRGILAFFDIDIAEGLAFQSASLAQHVEGLAVLLIQSLFGTFSIIDMDASFQSFHFQIAESLLAEIIEGALGCHSMTTDGTVLLALKSEL